ncbi:hypothetical protein HYT25_01435 [Candidatus Pacearchaeota archaeon]|nr:hypothetical protein [Candidatus Pacearchaeota archaeon]
MNLETGDNVLCTVERIEGTVVFVKVLANGKEIDGSIVTSEIAPGRIRNLRDYVVPKKKIVCKILRISEKGNVELSLRRVSAKERKGVMDIYNQERAYLSILKKVLGEKTNGIVEKILAEGTISDFVSEVRENPKKLENLIGKDSKKIMDMLNFQKEKKVVLKKEILLKSELPNGIQIIKKVLENVNGSEIRYLAAGKYSIKTESNDVKKASVVLRNVLEEIEKKARENRMDFSIREK